MTDLTRTEFERSIMSRSNEITLIGYTGTDAEVFQDRNNKLFAAFSLATHDSYKDKQGEWRQRKAVWHRILTFSPSLIEKMKDIKKGTRVEVGGSMSYKPLPVKLDNEKNIKVRIASVIARSITPKPLPGKQDQQTIELDQ